MARHHDGMILALDVGTTGLKATLFSATGELLADSRRGYTTQRSEIGAAEQDPRAWWRAACGAVRALSSTVADMPSRVEAVALAGMMNGCALVDGRGRPVHHALIHADTRSSQILEDLQSAIEPGQAYRLTGCHLAPYFTLAKLAWLRRTLPDVMTRARWCIQSKDYLVGRLTGVWGVTDPSDASLTGLYDVVAGRWHAGLLSAAGIEPRLMPDIHPSCEVIGHVTTPASRAMGLREGTPVVLGGGDGACATAGAGACRPGDAYHYLGGTSWIAVVTDRYEPDPHARTSHLVGLSPTQHVNYGTVQSAGTSIEWFLSEIGLGSRVPARRRLAALQPLAASSPPGARGLIFVPYLDGERAPLWDADARAALIGLTGKHTRADMARAVMEGVAFALGHVLGAFEDRGLAPEVVRVLGGGVRSRLWRSIFSAVYRRPLHVMSRAEFSTACGAAMAAACAIGICPTFEEAASRFVSVADIEYPDPSMAAVYDRLQAVYRDLYPALKPLYARLASGE